MLDQILRDDHPPGEKGGGGAGHDRGEHAVEQQEPHHGSRLHHEGVKHHVGLHARPEQHLGRGAHIAGDRQNGEYEEGPQIEAALRGFHVFGRGHPLQVVLVTHDDQQAHRNAVVDQLLHPAEALEEGERLRLPGRLVVLRHRLPSPQAEEHEAEGQKGTERLEDRLDEVGDHDAEEAGDRRVEQDDDRRYQHPAQMGPPQEGGEQERQGVEL